MKVKLKIRADWFLLSGQFNLPLFPLGLLLRSCECKCSQTAASFSKPADSRTTSWNSVLFHFTDSTFRLHWTERFDQLLQMLLAGRHVVLCYSNKNMMLQSFVTPPFVFLLNKTKLRICWLPPEAAWADQQGGIMGRKTLLTFTSTNTQL